MANVSFGYGVKSQKPSSMTDGMIYLATDTDELILKQGNNEIKITDFEIVQSASDLPIIGTQIANKFYYVSSENSLYKVVDNEWKVIGSKLITLTSAEYAALTPAQKNDENAYYIISDATIVDANVLSDLNDVNINNPSNNQALKYDSTTQQWVNGDAASAVNQLTDVQLTSLADGDILKYDSTSSKWINGQGAPANPILPTDPDSTYKNTPGAIWIETE